MILECNFLRILNLKNIDMEYLYFLLFLFAFGFFRIPGSTRYGGRQIPLPPKHLRNKSKKLN